MSKATQTDGQMNLRVSPEDRKLMRELSKKLGLKHSAILKLGLRRLAEQEKVAA